MRKINKMMYIVTIASVLALGLTVTSFASTISSVTIKVGHSITAGDTLPGITIGGDSGDDAYVSVSSSRYEIDDASWTTSTSKEMSVGSEPKMKVILEAQDDYYFKGTYRASNVNISGGTFISASRKNDGDTLEVTLSIKPIKGYYDEPENVEWQSSGLGKARWSNGESSSGYFDVTLYRSGSVVKKLECIKATSYDFYPYMTRKGTYSFKIRCVPGTTDEKKYGTKSGWTESDEVYVAEEDVSDGSGQTTGNGTGVITVGWIKNGSKWNYKYPDGNLQKNSWLFVDNKWYLFDSDGNMLTGWQTRGNRSYYLNDSGDMYTGWRQEGNLWYYLTPDAGDYQGAAWTGWLTINGQTRYLNSSGVMVEGWQQIDGNWYYFNPGSGVKAVNTRIDTFYVDGNGIWRH